MVNCITQVNISMQNKIQVNLNTPFPQKTKKRIILSLISVIVIILSVILYFMSSNMNQVKTHQEENKQNQTSKNTQANIEFSKMTEKDIKSSKNKVNILISFCLFLIFTVLLLYTLDIYRFLKNFDNHVL